MDVHLLLEHFLNSNPTEEECVRYLMNLRWPDGFVCPKCGSKSAYEIIKYHRLQCAVCRHQTSVTAGTVFHRMRHSCLTIFNALYHVSKGITVMELKRTLNIRSYQTAWLLHNNIRKVLDSSQMCPLEYDVSSDSKKN